MKNTREILYIGVEPSLTWIQEAQQQMGKF